MQTRDPSGWICMYDWWAPSSKQRCRHSAAHHCPLCPHIITGVEFENCTATGGSGAPGGGALYVAGAAGAPTVRSCSFRSCRAAAGSGGAVHVRGGSITVENSTFLGSVAAEGELPCLAHRRLRCHGRASLACVRQLVQIDLQRPAAPSDAHRASTRLTAAHMPSISIQVWASAARCSWTMLGPAWFGTPASWEVGGGCGRGAGTLGRLGRSRRPAGMCTACRASPRSTAAACQPVPSHPCPSPSPPCRPCGVQRRRPRCGIFQAAAHGAGERTGQLLIFPRRRGAAHRIGDGRHRLRVPQRT